jgi:DNA repair protein RadD
MQLHAYQQRVVDEVQHHKRPLIVAPTGSGKTVMASEVIRRAENKHVLFFAHRRELVFQPRDTLAKFGVNAGVILAGESLNRSARVQIASIQTLHARCMRGSDDLPPAELLFIDEAHHVPARTYRSVIERYPEAKLIGMTATPCRRDGRGLGNAFSAIVEAPQVGWLTENGFLVPTKVYAPSTPNLKGIRTRHGDYVDRELAEREAQKHTNISHFVQPEHIPSLR